MEGVGVKVTRVVVASVATAGLLLTGCSSDPGGDAGPKPISTPTPHSTYEPAVSWDCAEQQTRTMLGPAMEGQNTARAAAHIFPGSERVQLLHVSDMKRVALVQGLDQGLTRVWLKKVNNTWFIDSFEFCKGSN
jgi:hypothetical protein